MAPTTAWYVERVRIEEHPVPGMPLGRHVYHDSRNLAFPWQRQDRTLTSQLWTRHVPILDQGSVGSCYPPGVMIRMADGSERPIEDVHLLDRVVTAEGNTGRVMRTMVRDEDGGLIRLILWGHSHLRMTREHPILTKRGYIQASELRVGDQVALTRYLPQQHTAHIVTAEHVTQPSHRVVRGTRWQGLPGRRGLTAGSHAIPEKIELTPAFGRLIGLFLAEGNIDEAKVVFSLHLNEKDTFGEEIASVFATYGAQASRRDLPEHHGHKVSVHGTGWARLLSSLCGTGAGLKRLHPDLTSGPPEFLEAVLSGWRDGDGHRKKDAAEHTGITISHDLALAMYDIAQALGYRPVIRHTPPVINGYARTRQWRWEVATSGLDARNYSTQDDQHVWRKVREIRLEDYVGPVYDLTVEGDHSYVAEGIGVHNCTGNEEVGALGCDPCFGALPVSPPLLDENLALRIYSAAETIDGDGPYPPNDNGSSGPSAAQAARNLGLISGYLHCLSLADVLDALEEHPVGLGVNWYDCVMPSSRILTSNLNWVPIEKLGPGDEIIGFDETSATEGLRGRRYRRSTILANDPVVKPALTFYYDLAGREHELTVSEGHLFLVRNSNEMQGWRRADQLRINDVIYALVAPYEPSTSYEAGWLAGFFDGEGSVGVTTHKEKGIDRRPYRLDVSQRIGPTLDALKRTVSAFGFDFQVQQVRNLPDPAHPNWKPLEVLWLRGGRSEVLRFLGTIRPERLVANGAGFWEGQVLSSKAPLWGTITGIRKTGRQELRAIGTSTGTLIVEGLLSHNSMDSPDSSGHVAVSPGASVRGGHEFLCRGKDVDSRIVVCDNSWGTGWGKQGTFSFSWADLDRLLHEQGDGTVSLPLTTPAPVPVPVPVPTPVPPVPPNPGPDTNPDDDALARATSNWARGHHTGSNERAALAVQAWLQAKGL